MVDLTTTVCVKFTPDDLAILEALEQPASCMPVRKTCA
jgi:hypothetical protein